MRARLSGTPRQKDTHLKKCYVARRGRGRGENRGNKKLRETDTEIETKRENGFIEEQIQPPPHPTSLLLLSMVWK